MKVAYFESYGPVGYHGAFVPKDETQSARRIISQQSKSSSVGQTDSVSRSGNIILLHQVATLIPAR
jgi:hypothetical protein